MDGIDVESRMFRSFANLVFRQICRGEAREKVSANGIRATVLLKENDDHERDLSCRRLFLGLAEIL